MIARSLQLVNELWVLMEVVAEWVRNRLSLAGGRKMKERMSNKTHKMQ